MFVISPCELDFTAPSLLKMARWHFVQSQTRQLFKFSGFYTAKIIKPTVAIWGCSDLKHLDFGLNPLTKLIVVHYSAPGAFVGLMWNLKIEVANNSHLILNLHDRGPGSNNCLQHGAQNFSSRSSSQINTLWTQSVCAENLFLCQMKNWKPSAQTSSSYWQF